MKFGLLLTKSAPACVIPDDATNITSSEEYSELPQQHAITLAGDNAKWKYDVRFNIDGRPVYLFFVTPDGTEYYAGRYNMNNDKSNVQVFGFEKVTDYFENDIVKQEGKYLQQKAIEEGKILQERYERYCKIYEELKAKEAHKW